MLSCWYLHWSSLRRSGARRVNSRPRSPPALRAPFQGRTDDKRTPSTPSPIALFLRDLYPDHLPLTARTLVHNPAPRADSSRHRGLRRPATSSSVDVPGRSRFTKTLQPPFDLHCHGRDILPFLFQEVYIKSIPIAQSILPFLDNQESIHSLSFRQPSIPTFVTTTRHATFSQKR